MNIYLIISNSYLKKKGVVKHLTIFDTPQQMVLQREENHYNLIWLDR